MVWIRAMEDAILPHPRHLEVQLNTLNKIYGIEA